MRFGAALDRVQVPVLLIGGWQDLFLQQSLQQYRHLRDRGVDVALTMGPWTHAQFLVQGLRTIAQETQDWLDTHLGGRPTAPRRGRVRFFVAGEGWREVADWPPTTSEHALYLQPGGGLTDTPPSSATVPGVVGELSLSTPPTRRRPSGVGCCRRTAVTGTTPRWPPAATC